DSSPTPLRAFRVLRPPAPPTPPPAARIGKLLDHRPTPADRLPPRRVAERLPRLVVQAHGPERGGPQAGLGKIDVAKRGPVEHAAIEVCAEQRCRVDARASELCPAKIGPAEIVLSS